jgi:hypothetical protein
VIGRRGVLDLEMATHHRQSDTLCNLLLERRFDYRLVELRKRTHERLEILTTCQSVDIHHNTNRPGWLHIEGEVVFPHFCENEHMANDLNHLRNSVSSHDQISPPPHIAIESSCPYYLIQIYLTNIQPHNPALIALLCFIFCRNTITRVSPCLSFLAVAQGVRVFRHAAISWL